MHRLYCRLETDGCIRDHRRDYPFQSSYPDCMEAADEDYKEDPATHLLQPWYLVRLVLIMFDLCNLILPKCYYHVHHTPAIFTRGCRHYRPNLHSDWHVDYRIHFQWSCAYMRCRPHHQKPDTILPERVQDAHKCSFRLHLGPQHLQLHEQTKLQVIAGQKSWL